MPACLKCGNWISKNTEYTHCLRCGHLISAPVEASLGPPPAKTDHSRRNAALLVVGLILAYYVVAGRSIPSPETTKTISAAASPAPQTASPPRTPSPTPEAPHIGSVIEAGNWRYSVRQVDTPKTYTTGSGFLATTHTAKGIWVIVLIQLTNIGNRNYSINTFDFQLRDDKGIRYDPESSYAFNLPPGHMNFGEQVPPGVPLLATLYFDVAPGTTGMYLYLSNVGLLERAPVIYLY